MAEPLNALEYLKRFHENQKIDGYGIGNVHVHVPCPFCAAADFVVHEMLEVEVAMQKGAVCKECGRGARAVFERRPGMISFEFVQTVGPDQPEWLTPKMRRLPAQ
jgi:hypothetical protein